MSEDRVKTPKGAQIIKCACQHAGQDRLHGSQMRVHNQTSKPKAQANKSGAVFFRCTVCGREQ